MQSYELSVCVRVSKNEWTGWKCCCVLVLQTHASRCQKIRMLTASHFSTWQMLNHEEILGWREAASSPPFVAPASQRGWNFPGKLIAGCWQDVTDNTANNAGSRWPNTRFYRATSELRGQSQKCLDWTNCEGKKNGRDVKDAFVQHPHDKASCEVWVVLPAEKKSLTHNFSGCVSLKLLLLESHRLSLSQLCLMGGG